MHMHTWPRTCASQALLGAMNHAAVLAGEQEGGETQTFTARLRKSMHRCMVSGKGTRDLCGPSGLTTEAFIAAVKAEFESLDDFSVAPTQARHAPATARHARARGCATACPSARTPVRSPVRPPDRPTRPVRPTRLPRPCPQAVTPIEDDAEYDEELVQKLFAKLDTDSNGSIDYGELKIGLRRLNVAPKNLTSILAQQWEGRD